MKYLKLGPYLGGGGNGSVLALAAIFIWEEGKKVKRSDITILMKKKR